MLHGFLTEAEGLRGDREPFDAAAADSTDMVVDELTASDTQAGAVATQGTPAGGWLDHFDELVAHRRATRLWPGGERQAQTCLWVAAERLPEFRAL